jgi:secreted PhoX family phosphatase
MKTSVPLNGARSSQLPDGICVVEKLGAISVESVMSKAVQTLLLSRRRFFKTAAATAAGAASLLASDQALAEKVSKAKANYRDRPNGEARCFNCMHYFIGYCSIVSGRVKAQGWCRFHER